MKGVVAIARYNWPYYALALSAIAVGAIGARVLPAPLDVASAVGAALAAYFTLASLLASWWVYDRSPLYAWRWIPAFLETQPESWANIHAGLDESSSALRRMYPLASGSSFDCHDPAHMTEPSLARARARRAKDVSTLDAPWPTGRVTRTFDAIFVLFAAHEIRDPEDRRRFFWSLRRRLAPNGRVLLVEHLRDLPNFLAFGPGYRHFYKRAEWLALAHDAGFKILKEERHTPFVRAFLLEPRD